MVSFLAMSKLNLLFAHNEQNWRLFAARTLADEWRVIPCDSVSSALVLIRFQRLDAAILDLNLQPGTLNGSDGSGQYSVRALVERLKSEGTHVGLITGWPIHETNRIAAELQVQVYEVDGIGNSSSLLQIAYEIHRPHPATPERRY